MEKEQILLQFKDLYKTSYGFSISGNSYCVSDQGVKKGHLSEYMTSFEAEDVQLYFPIALNKDSGILFLLSLLKEFTITEEWDDTLQALVRGKLSGPVYEKTLADLFGKRLDYIKIDAEDEYTVISLIEASLPTVLLLSDEKGFFAFVDENLEKEVLEGLVGTLQTELLVNCQWIIGHGLKGHQSVENQANWLRENAKLSERFSLKDFVLESERLFVYQLISGCNPEMKSYLMHQVVENYHDLESDEELVATIEHLFDKNINLTDTARVLFIHRNTLLYRIDKIYKITGFDLRKFSDSFIFKIAWLMRKEQL